MLHHQAEAQSNITVPMSGQSAVPMTDSASQSNYPAPQSSPVLTDEEKVFCDMSQPSVADKKEGRNWYIARCYRGKRSVKPLYEEILTNYPQIEVYWPQKPVKKGRDDKEIIPTPILSEFLFIKSDIQILLKLFRNERIKQLGFLMRRMSISGNLQYAVVKDSEMLKFKWVCDNQFDSLIVIAHQSTQLREGLKVRVTDGLLKGKVGVIFRYKGSRSFAVSFDDVLSDETEGTSDMPESSLPISGYMVFRVTKSLQQNLEVIDDDKKTRNMYSVMSLVDMLQSHIRNIKDEKGEYPYFSASAYFLNLLILNRLYHSPQLSSGQLKKYRWLSRESDIQEKSARTNKLLPKEYELNDESVVFPEFEQINSIKATLHEFHTEALDYLVQYSIINLERHLLTYTRPVLADILLASQISPFITNSTHHKGKVPHCSTFYNDFMEYVIKLGADGMEDTIQKTLYSQPLDTKGMDEKKKFDYYAHIGVFHDEKNGYSLITNWSSYEKLIEEYKLELKDEEAAKNKNAVIALKKMPMLYSVLKEENSSNVTFGSHKGIYGTMMRIPMAETPITHTPTSIPDIVQQEAQQLIKVSVAILKEIWSSPVYDLRKNLPKVWIRPATINVCSIN